MNDDQQQSKSPRQMTFGNNTLIQSRNLSIQYGDDVEGSVMHFQPLNMIVSPPQLTQLENIQETENSPVRKFRIESDENSESKPRGSGIDNQRFKEEPQSEQAVKKDYLRKGSNSRTRYDP